MNRVLLIVLLLASSLATRSQDTSTLIAVRHTAQSNTNGLFWKKSAANPRNEIQMLFSGLFLFYKHFVSSQDGGHCNFYPTCSEYSLLSIKKHGLVAGALATFDRLVRCNPASPEYYETDAEGRQIDHP